MDCPSWSLKSIPDGRAARAGCGQYAEILNLLQPGPFGSRRRGEQVPWGHAVEQICLIRGKFGQVDGVVQRVSVQRADFLAIHTINQVVVPARIDPSGEGGGRFVLEGQAALRVNQEPVGGDGPIQGAPPAGGTFLAPLRQTEFLPGVHRPQVCVTANQLMKAAYTGED